MTALVLGLCRRLEGVPIVNQMREGWIEEGRRLFHALGSGGQVREPTFYAGVAGVVGIDEENDRLADTKTLVPIAKGVGSDLRGLRASDLLDRKSVV